MRFESGLRVNLNNQLYTYSSFVRDPLLEARLSPTSYPNNTLYNTFPQAQRAPVAGSAGASKCMMIFMTTAMYTISAGVFAFSYEQQPTNEYESQPIFLYVTGSVFAMMGMVLCHTMYKAGDCNKNEPSAA